jgi:hypothetical protein
MMQNNVAYQREQCCQNNNNNNPSTENLAFLYAVQPGGKLLGETLWEKEQQGGMGYTFREDNIEQQRRSGISLSNIEKMMTKCRLQYQQQASLPIEPPPDAAAVVGKVSSNSNLTKYNDSSDKVSCYNMHGEDQQQKNPVQYYDKGQVGKPIIKENCHPNYSGPNRSHPGGVHPDNYNGKDASLITTTSTVVNHDSSGDCDEEYDSILADFDVDQVISKHKQNDSSGGLAMSCDRPMPSGGDDSSSFVALSQTGFDYGSTCEESTAVQGPTSRYAAASSSFTGNAGLHNGTSSRKSFWTSDNDGPSSFDNCNQNDNFNYDDPSSRNQQDGDTPVCPGHGVPCRVLTANTAVNMGREFYKCSLPEGQNCDFFQWKDGVEGNCNNHYETGTTTIGDVRDMHEGNRRIFGHQSFRPGQKDVIEKAIQGRDVFVLMPTG